MVEIVYITDANYITPTATSICSLKSNRNKDTRYTITVLCQNTSKKDESKITALEDNNFEIIIKNVSGYDKSYALKEIPASPAALLKFDLAEIFSESDKILYLDGDTLIQEDLLPLFNIDLGNKYAAVVKDYIDSTDSHVDKLGIPNEDYFNTGVMLLNLKAIRENDLSKKLMDYRKNGFNKYMDQDAFNVIFNHMVLYLGLEYNCMYSVITFNNFEKIKNYYHLPITITRGSFVSSSKIVHICSGHKPWKYRVGGFSELFLMYYSQLPIKEQLVLNSNTFSTSSKIIKSKKICEIDEGIKISIIIPAYNVEQYIEESLTSAIYQTYSNIEIICVNDGSTDNTLQIIEDIKKNDERVVIIDQKNSGAGSARNAGIKRSTGDYILFLDGDDYLEQDCVATLADLVKQHPTEVIFFNFREINNDKNRNVQLFNYDESESIILNNTKYSFNKADLSNKLLFYRNCVTPWNKLYDSKFIKNNNILFPEHIRYAEDRPFYFEVLNNLKSAICLNAIFNNHRTFLSSSHTDVFTIEKMECRIKGYEETIKKLPDDDRTQYAYFLATISDIISFSKRSDKKTKYEIFLKIVEFFNTIDTSAFSKYFPKEDALLFKYNFIKQSKYLLKQKTSHIVSVVYCTNNNYAPMAGVSIQSLIDNSSKNKFYDVYILHTSLNNEKISDLRALCTDNVHIRIINIKPLIKQQSSFYSLAHYSIEMFYRWYIPELLPHYNKTCYIDCDTIIVGDIANFYSYDLKNYALIASKNESNKDMEAYVKNRLNISPEHYFNTGVLLINNDKFAELNIFDRVIKLLSESRNYACPDQDALNIIAGKYALVLGDRWNFQWHKDIKNNHSCSYTNQKIIHYSSEIKPWTHPEYHLSKEFWKYARKSPFYEELLIKNITIKNTKKEPEKNNQNKKLKNEKTGIIQRTKTFYSKEYNEKGFMKANGALVRAAIYKLRKTK